MALSAEGSPCHSNVSRTMIVQKVLAIVSTVRYSAYMASRIPTFPSVDFSKLDLSQLSLPTVDTDAVVGAVKDAGYITVGLAVLAAQKAQVRRQELKKSLGGQVGNGRAQAAEVVDAVEAGLASLDKTIIALEAKLDGAVEQLEKRLPERAASVVGQAHEAAKVVRQQVRSLVALGG